MVDLSFGSFSLDELNLNIQLDALNFDSFDNMFEPQKERSVILFTTRKIFKYSISEVWLRSLISELRSRTYGATPAPAVGQLPVLYLNKSI